MFLLLSPITGWVAPLDETPDEAFATQALGDGVAIDPTEGVLRAPCDGVIVTVAATGHAVSMRSEDGAEILMHLGVDTVALKGEGFQVHVIVGQAVRAGEALITFDLDAVARGARSLMTPVLVTNGDRFEIVRRAQGLAKAGEMLLELMERSAVVTEPSRTEPPNAVSVRFVTDLSEGVHARPAARIVAAARAAGVDIAVGAHGRTAPALSALGLMGLGIGHRDEVTLWTAAPLEELALAALKEAFAAIPDATAASRAARPGPAAGVLSGSRGSPGLAIGEAFWFVRPEISLPAHSGGAADEGRALDAALVHVKHSLRALAADEAGERGDILRAHLVLLDDPALLDAAQAEIGGGASAGAAWRAAIWRQADLFAMAKDRRLRERRADLLDLERQVLTRLYGAAPQSMKPPAECIVLAGELLPSELAALANLGVAGVAMAGGGATSHVAIMASAMGLPMLTAVADLGGVVAGALVILDADQGRLTVAPDGDVLSEVRGRSDRRRLRRAAASAAAAEPCLAVDGARIAVYANLGRVWDTERAVAEGAEGCGLLRSEFLFQDRASPPGEDEQQAAYQAVADALDGRPLTIRTLDIGADKPAPYLALPAEENPALGLRGVRVSLWRPELLRVQLRAILRVKGVVAIMAPMVASTHEIATVQRLLAEEAGALGAAIPPLGVMVGDAGRRPDHRCALRGGGLLLHRHQRPDPIRPRHGPHPADCSPRRSTDCIRPSSP